MEYHYRFDEYTLLRILDRAPHGILVEFQGDVSRRFSSAEAAARAAYQHESG